MKLFKLDKYRTKMVSKINLQYTRDDDTLCPFSDTYLKCNIPLNIKVISKK